MTQLQGLVEQVETWPARSFAVADAAVSAAVVYIADAAPFLNQSGSCTVDIAGVEYTATPTSSTDTDYLTLSPPLSVAVADGDPIVLVPAASVKWAWVSQTDDDSAELIQARVPHELVGYLALSDGPRELGAQETVVVETDPEPVLVAIVNQVPVMNAATTPIVIDGPDGESARMDGDGLSFKTDNSLPIRTFLIPGGSNGDISSNGNYSTGGNLLAIDSNADIRVYNLTSGIEALYSPIAGTFTKIAASDSYAFAVTATNIRKYDMYTGVENTSGFPITGTFSEIAASDNGSYIYAIDSSTSDIRKFNASTGVENTSGFPIVGTFTDIATDGNSVYAIDNAGDIRKFDAATGVENTSGFPIAASYASIAVDYANVYASSFLGTVHRYDSTTGAEVVTDGWPLQVAAGSHLAAGVAGVIVQDTNSPSSGIRYFNTTPSFESVNVSAADGTVTAYKIATTDVSAAGEVAVTGGVSVGGNLTVNGNTTLGDSTSDTVTIGTYPITGAWTSYTPSWTGSITNPVINNGSITGAYQRIGQTVHFRVVITMGSTTTYGSGAYFVTLPFDAVTPYRPFMGSLFDSSAGSLYSLSPSRYGATANQILLQTDPSTAGGALRNATATVPVTLANGDEIVVTGVYEAA